MKHLREKYFGENVTFNERLFNLTTILSGSFSLVFILVGIFLTIEPVFYVSFALVSLLSFFLFFLNQKVHRANMLTHILLIFCNFICFPFLMVYTDNNMLEMPVYFIIGLVFAVLLLKGFERVIFFFSQMVIDLFTVYYCFVLRYDTEMIFGAMDKMECIRMFVAIVDVFTLCGIIVIYRNNLLTAGIKEAIDSTKRAEEYSVAKDMFLVNVSHEIRTPLNAILGSAEIILDSDTNNTVKEMAYNISNSGQALLSVTTDLLDFSRLDITEKNKIIEERYDVSNMFNDIINQMAIKTDDSLIDFFANINPLLPHYLYGDRIKIRQIILNMLMNAVNYTSAGHVALSVDLRDLSDKEIELIVKVSDTGEGMQPDVVETMFMPFNKFGSDDEAATEGNGLGLSFSQEFAKAMGGLITAKSVVSEGTTLTLTLKQKKAFDENDMHIAHVYDKKQSVCFYCFLMSEGENIEYALSNMEISYKHAMTTSDFIKTCVENEYSYYMLDSMTYDRIKNNLNEAGTDWRKIVLICNNNYNYSKEPFENAITRPINCLNLADFLNKTRNFSVRIQHFEGNFTIPGATILVVDDNMVNLEVAYTLLSRYFPRIITATSGKDGIIAIKNEHIDMVYLDYMMPEMDGIDTLKVIRSMEDGRFISLPVVCLTANAISGAKELFMKEGFNDYLSKPIEVDKLERTLLELLPSGLIKYNI